MGKAIVLKDCEIAAEVYIAADENGANLVFDSPEDADDWVEENARFGWCTQIIEID